MATGPRVDFLAWQERLEQFNAAIKGHITQEDWENLSVLLNDRQAWLEALATMPLAESEKPQAKQFARNVAELDNAFLAQIQQLQAQAKTNQLAFEKGKRALRAYRAG
ncbi:hypothetical protein BJL95_19295 [Methylomonas sp. LWB]|uniref:flagellar protein FliT n=1 Tax=Methylomonas sp. LWB TaxID=1905845 RepID=UPI0008D91290|nr:flagellar protein FliT [Methylomonas sp. LWB]OHX34668.1 hypothetical protein BJL95_19295 [Methylomonas sp. LWB]